MRNQLFTVFSLLLLMGFAVTANAQLLPPENLTAEAGDGYVNLFWDEPGTVPPDTEELIYDNDVWTDAYNYVGFTMATRMSPADECQVLTLRFLTGGTGQFNAEVYNWAGTQPGTTLLFTQAVSGINEEWVDVDVSNENLIIDGDFVVGFGSINQLVGLGYDANLNNNRSWDFQHSTQTWTTWNEAYLIRAVVQYTDGTRKELTVAGSIPVDTPAYQATERTMMAVNGGNVPRTGRDLLGYNIYRDTEMINVDPVLMTEYTDDDVENGVTYSYYVTAVYTDGESIPSNTVEATPEGVGPVLPPPLNLTATLVGDDSVMLEWDEPEFGSWIHWDSGVNTGNAIGVDGPFVFKVAARFSPDNLADFGVAGSYLTTVSFFPAEQAATYAINVWTGGTSSAPGPMVVDQAVPSPVIGDWNEIELDTPVYIAGDEELWFGYHIDTTAGFPAGCDAGPAIDGFGNMIYTAGQWDTLLDLNAALNYNWNIQGFASFAPDRELISIGQARRSDYVAQEKQVSYYNNTNPEFLVNSTSNTVHAPAAHDSNRLLTGYRVYRDDVDIADVTETMYLDEDLEPGLYTYYVTAVYDDEESAPSNSVIVNTQVSTILFDDFEAHEDFALQFPPWTLLDLDQYPTWGIADVTFPNEESPMAYIIFNPSQTTPPLALEAYSGEKMAASFAANPGPNNDWMITPQVSLGDNSIVSFWARSYTDQYGLERMKVGVSSTSMNPNTFTMVTPDPYVEVPTAWTHYSFDISDWDNQDVYVAVNCVSNDAFIFFVDDFQIDSIVEVSIDEEETFVPVTTQLKANYPNPFNPETTISFALQQPGDVTIEIFNIKGQKVATIVDGYYETGTHKVVWDSRTDRNREAGSGIYFYRMKSGDYSATKKMILMK